MNLIESKCLAINKVKAHNRSRMNFQIDLRRDWLDRLKQELHGMAYTIDPSTPDEQIPLIYFNAILRRIPQKRRRVHISSEFTCPTANQSGLQTLQAKIENGEDLTPHLSRLLKRANFDDDALNDFGVHHLHLGINVQADGFIERTGPILFALFQEDDAYLIQVYTHSDFSNREVVEIVHRNWPHVIANYAIPGVVDIAFNPDSDEIAELRKIHVNPSLQMDDGTVYLPLGGGLSTSGVSSTVARQSLRAAKLINEAKKSFEQNIPTIVEDLKSRGALETDTVEFHLDSRDTGLYALNAKHGVSYKLVAFPAS